MFGKFARPLSTAAWLGNIVWSCLPALNQTTENAIFMNIPVFSGFGRFSYGSPWVHIIFLWITNANWCRFLKTRTALAVGRSLKVLDTNKSWKPCETPKGTPCEPLRKPLDNLSKPCLAGLLACFCLFFVGCSTFCSGFLNFQDSEK